MFSYFDVNCMIGRSVVFQEGSFFSTNRLIKEMDYYRIKEGLVFHSLSKEYHPKVGNKELLNEIKVNDRLHGCWVLLPSHTEEMDSPEMIVRKMLRSGIKVVRLFPKSHFYKLSGWCMGDTLAVLEKHRVPVLLDFETEHPFFDTIDWEAVAMICLEYPNLPVVLMQIGLRTNRMLYPLLAKCKNLHIDISGYWIYCGIESICKSFGADRVLFGTRLPLYDPGFSLGMLSYSNIAIEEKRLIAGDNLRRMIREVNVDGVT